MKTRLISLLLVVSVAAGGAPSRATVSPDPDQLGLYFDTGADVACLTVGHGIPFFAYLVLTNVSAPEIQAIEFSMCTEVVGGGAGQLFELGKTWYGTFLDLGIVYDWCLDGRLIGFTEPIPRVGGNVVLVRLHYMLLGDLNVQFFLGPFPHETIADGLPAYLDADGVVVPLGVSSGDTGLPVAEINGDCSVVAVEAMTFSGVKSLYR